MLDQFILSHIVDVLAGRCCQGGDAGGSFDRIPGGLTAICFRRVTGCFFLVIRADGCTDNLDNGVSVHHIWDDVQLDFCVLRGVFGKPRAHTVVHWFILLDGSDTTADHKGFALYDLLQCPALVQIALVCVVTGLDNQIVVVNCLHGKILSVPLLGTLKNQHRRGKVGGSTVHIRQQHVVDHLQNVHRDALAVLQSGFDTGNVLCTSCIVVVWLPAARAVWIVLHGFTFFPARL